MLYNFLFSLSSTGLPAVHRNCRVGKTVFASSDTQDCCPPASQRRARSPRQLRCSYGATQAALPCEHQRVSIAEGALDLEQRGCCRAEEWLG